MMSTRYDGVSVESRKVMPDPARCEGPLVAEVVNGELYLSSDDGERVRACQGDIVVVAPQSVCQIRATAHGAEILVFHAGRDWVLQACELAQCTIPDNPVAFAVDRAGTGAARRTARLLRGLSAPRPGTAQDALSESARRLDALALACEPREATLDGAPVRRAASQRRDGFLMAVRGLGEASLENVSLGSLADQIGLSERQVSRLFREEFGMTFREYLTELRIERARALLLDTELTIIEIAGETGWSSLPHFNAIFRRRTGTTPSQFRERSRRRGSQAMASTTAGEALAAGPIRIDEAP